MIKMAADELRSLAEIEPGRLVLVDLFVPGEPWILKAIAKKFMPDVATLGVKYSYLGVIGDGGIKDWDNKITLFRKDRYVALEPDNGSQFWLNPAEHDSGDFSISRIYQSSLKLLKFKDRKEFEDQQILNDHRILLRSHYIGGYPRQIQAVNIYLGDSAIVYDYFVDHQDPFKMRDVSKKLGLNVTDRLKEKLEKRAKELITDVFCYTFDKNAGISEQKLRSVLGIIKQNGVPDIVSEFEVRSGVKINVPNFLAGVEKDLEAASRARSKV